MKKLSFRKKILLFLGIAIFVVDLFWVGVGVLMLSMDLRGGSGSVSEIEAYLNTPPEERRGSAYDYTPVSFERYKTAKEYAYGNSPYKRPYLIRYTQKNIILSFFE